MSSLNVVLHCHSNWSYDGHWSLRGISRLYDAFGVDAVMMTEHDTGFDANSFDAYREACAAGSTTRCRLIPGIEYSCPDNSVHFLVWGLDRFLQERMPIMKTLEAVAEAEGAAVFAHPARRDAYTLFDPAWIPYLSGIEIWNRKTDGLASGRDAELLVSETGLPATVGQDFHRLKNFYPLTMRAPKAGGDLESGLVNALRTKQMVPLAFRSPILDEHGNLQSGLHSRVNVIWKGLKHIRNQVQKR